MRHGARLEAFYARQYEIPGKRVAEVVTKLDQFVGERLGAFG